MKATADCIPCIENHVLLTAKQVSEDEWLRRKVLLETMDVLRTASYDHPPAEICHETIKAACKMLGTTDPYRNLKKELNKLSLSAAAKLDQTIRQQNDSLYAALRAACAANALDILSPPGTQPKDVLDSMKTCPLQIDAYDQFREDIQNARKVLYVLDNAGEIAFDKLVIQQLLDKDVTCIVRTSPILNDATLEDAQEVSLTEICTVTDPGADMLGLSPDLCSSTFKETFNSADIIIAKGTASLETLENTTSKTVYFLLTVKCEVIAKHLGVKIGDMVFFKD